MYFFSKIIVPHNRRTWLRLSAVVYLLLGHAFLNAAVPSTITSASQLWDLPDAEKNQLHPVSFELIVYYYDPEWQLLWGECDGTPCYLRVEAKMLPIKAGQRYLVQGDCLPAKGLSADLLTFTLLPEKTIPILTSKGQPNDPALNSRLVTIEGYVNRAIGITGHHWRLELLWEGNLVTCNVWHDKPGVVPFAEDALVQATGVYLFKADPTGSLDTADLWVSSPEKVEVLGSLKTDPRFSLQATPIEKLPRVRSGQLIRVEGTVTRFTPGREMVIRDESGQLELKTAQVHPAKVGDRVEAIGYTWINGTEWTLRRGLFRIMESANGSQVLPAIPKLRVIEQILELTPQQAAQGYPVQIRGVVLWSAPESPFFVLQDSSGSICVQRDNMQNPTPSLANDVVVEGFTKVGAFAPAVQLLRLDVAGNVTLPEAKPVTLEQTLTGVEENQWVEMTGYLREIKNEGPWTYLTLVTAAGEFTARLPSSDEVKKLLGAVVRIQGVCIATANEAHQLTGVNLFVPSGYYVQVDEPAPADPFKVSARTIASLRQYSTLKASNRRVRLAGIVLHQVLGRYVLIQDDSDGLLVLSRSMEPLSPGNCIEVVGFLGRESSRVVLREAIYRKTSTGKEPTPLHLMNPEQANATLHDHLVAITGTLVDKSIRDNNIHLTIQTRDRVFEAILERRPNSEISGEWLSGSELRVTGVYEIEVDEDRQPYAYHLLLRSPADVVVITKPSWWTTRHAVLVAGGTFGCILLAIGWAVALRRRVKKQMVQIRIQLEKETHLEAQYRDIFESANDFIFTIDPSGRFTSFNTAGEKMTDYSREQALQMNFRDLLMPEDVEGTLPLLEQMQKKDAPVTFQRRFRTRTGGVTWAETNIQLIFKSDVAIGMLGVVRDINERKQIEEALRQARDNAETTTRAKSAFLANMSHEIRTPMNGVIGMSNLLLDTKLNPEQRDLAETVRHSAESLLTILNDILDFSKIEAGRLQFDTIDFDLREMVDGTLDLLSARAQEKKLELGALIPHDLPCQVRGDPGRLRQILLNLLSNALKFTEKGEVFLSLSLEQETDLGVRVLFKISDTGIGLTDEVKARLFKPFSQADETTTRKYGGTGLGLAISKQIVELMDGHIGVESRLNEGSTFWFSVLLAKQQGQEAAPLDSSLDKLKEVPVLVIDQNKTNCKILQHYLGAWQMNVRFASSKDTALSILRKAEDSHHRIQILIINHHLEEINGIELAPQLRQQPTHHAVLMVLLTSLEQQFSKEELAAAGILCALSTPIRRSELQHAMLKAMKPGQASASPDPATIDTNSSVVQPVSRQLRILVAEDNIVNQRVTTRQLSKLGHKTEVAANGLEVLSTLEKNDFDVVLMDCQMPEMDGYEATRRIRQHSRLASQWIIAMTANAMIGDRETCMEAGMNDYITKPTRMQDLVRALQRCPAGITETK